jgi:hypothetical protein
MLDLIYLAELWEDLTNRYDTAGEILGAGRDTT